MSRDAAPPAPPAPHPPPADPPPGGGGAGRRRRAEITIAILAGQEAFFDAVRRCASRNGVPVSEFAREALRMRIAHEDDGLSLHDVDARLAALEKRFARQEAGLSAHDGLAESAIRDFTAQFVEIRRALASLEDAVARLAGACASPAPRASRCREDADARVPGA